MKRIFFLLSLLTLTLQSRAQGVWCEGTSWETHYDNGTVETFTLNDSAVINETTYMKLVSDASGLVGYIRAEQGDKLVYARGIVNERVLDECLLYDFSKSFEYGDVFRYGVLQNGVPTVAEVPMERETAKIVWYEDVLGEGTSLPAWDNILYKVGWLGNPMELFYQKEEASSAHKAPGRPKPNTTNVSHIVFRPGGGKPKVLRTVRYEINLPSEEMKDFAFRLYDAMLKRNKEANLVMTPLSAQIAVSMLMNGADGETLQQIRSAMGVSDYTDEQVNSYNMQLVESMLALQEEEDVRLEIINGLWTQNGFPFEESFFQNIRNYYDAEPENVDFGTWEAVDYINGWAKDKSHGLIEKILERPNSSLFVMLANSLYFKGRWKYFDSNGTHKAEFHNADGSTTEVDMMCSRDFGAEFMFTDDYLALELAYGDVEHGGYYSNFGMLIFLPRNPGDELKITKELFDQTVAGLKRNSVQLYMPRFKVNQDCDLDSVFMDMGMTDMFNFRKADLSKMTPFEPCFVNSAKQFISYSVDENGTEAAGITVILGGYFGDSSMPVSLDRPFQFVLYDKVHNIPLFIGQVNNMKDAINDKPMDDGSTEGFYCKFDKNTKEATIVSAGYGALYKGDLVIPDSIHSNGEAYAVTKIGERAFYGCPITSVSFPQTLKEIEGNAFDACPGITSIDLSENIAIHGNLLFEGCVNLVDVILPDTLTCIPNDCFRSCKKLKRVNLPSALQEIRDMAFIYCESLDSIVLPPNTQRINSNAFGYCTNLKYISIPQSLQSIGKDAFLGCPTIDEVEFESLDVLLNINFAGEFSNPLRNTKHLVINREHVTDLVIPDGCKRINDYTFTGCGGVKSVIIPESLDSIGQNSFSECPDLESVTFLHSPAVIGSGSFSKCRNLKNLDLSDRVEIIKNSAFSYCNIQYFALPASVKRICGNAFIGNNKMVVDIMSLESLCAMELENDSSNPLRDGQKVCLRGEEAKKLILPEGITEIRDYVFYGARTIESFVIPASVQKIGYQALANNTLTSVYILGGRIPEINQRIFYRKNQITLYVPESMIPEYKASELWSGFKAILPLPDGFDGIEKRPLSGSPEGERMGAMYDLQGRKLGKAPEKGIYIQDGKKVIR